MAENPWGNWKTFDARFLARALSAVAILSLLALAYFWPRPDPIVLAAQAEANISRGNLSAAYRQLRQAVSARPYSFDLHLMLAQVLAAAHQYDRALQEQLLAAELNPSADLASSITELKDKAAAPKRLRAELSALVGVLATYPVFRDAWVRAAYLHYLLKEDAAAKAALGRALEIDPNFEPALKVQAILK